MTVTKYFNFFLIQIKMNRIDGAMVKIAGLSWKIAELALNNTHSLTEIKMCIFFHRLILLPPGYEWILPANDRPVLFCTRNGMALCRVKSN
jgi:hypothetical protein